MAWDPMVAARALHVIAAALWVGGAFFMAFILGPNFAAAGPAAGPFMMTVMRRGGLSWYFLSVGGVALLAGAYAFSSMGYADNPFGTAGSGLVTVGAMLAVLAYLHGLFVLLPNERRIKALVRSAPAQGPPPPEMAATFQQFGMKQGKHSAISAMLLTLTLLAMTLRGLF